MSSARSTEISAEILNDIVSNAAETGDEESARVTMAATTAVPLKSDASGAPAFNPEAWQVVTVLPRLDSFNHSDLMTEIHSILAEGTRRVALDLTQNKFFSLNAIQLCVSLARDLANDDGSFALIGCPERTKRHFDVYGSLKQIVVVRSVAELVQGRTATVVIRPKVSSQEAR